MNTKKHKENALSQQKSANEDFNDESVTGQKCEICKTVSEDLAAHLMTHMKTCSVLIFKLG